MWRGYLHENQVDEITAQFATDVLVEYLNRVGGFYNRLWRNIFSDVVKKCSKRIDPDLRKKAWTEQAAGAIISFLPRIGVANKAAPPLPSSLDEEEIVATLAKMSAWDYLALFPQSILHGTVTPFSPGLLDRIVDLYCMELLVNAHPQTEARRLKARELATESIRKFNAKEGAIPLPSEIDTPLPSTALLDERISAFAEEWKRAHAGAEVDVGAMKRAYLIFCDRIRSRLVIGPQEIAGTPHDAGFLSGFIAHQQRDIEHWRSLVTDRECGLVRLVRAGFDMQLSADAALLALAAEYAADRLASPQPRSLMEIARMVGNDALSDFSDIRDNISGFYCVAFHDWFTAIEAHLSWAVECAVQRVYSLAKDAQNAPHSPEELYERFMANAFPFWLTAARKHAFVRQMLGLQAQEVDLHVEAQRAFQSPEAEQAREGLKLRIANENQRIQAIAIRVQDLSRQAETIEGRDDCAGEIARLRNEAEQAEIDRRKAVSNIYARSFSDEVAPVWHTDKQVRDDLAKLNEALNKADCVARAAGEIAAERGRILAADASKQKLPAIALIEMAAARDLGAEIEKILAEFKAVSAEAEVVEKSGRIAVGTIMRSGSDVASFGSAMEDAKLIHSTAVWKIARRLGEIGTKFAQLMDAQEDPPRKAKASTVFDALYDVQNGLPASLAEPIMETIERLSNTATKGRRVRPALEDLIDRMRLTSAALKDALLATESSLPIAPNAKVPKTVVRIDEAADEPYEFKLLTHGQELDGERRHLFDPILEGSVLSLPLRGESYLLSKSTAAETKKWIKIRWSDTIVRDIFGHLVPLSMDEFGVRLAGYDELPDAHPFRSLLTHLKNASEGGCCETRLLIALMILGSSELLSNPILARDKNPGSPASMLGDLMAWMALAPLAPTKDNTRLIVRRWANENPQLIFQASNGEVRSNDESTASDDASQEASPEGCETGPAAMGPALPVLTLSKPA